MRALAVIIGALALTACAGGVEFVEEERPIQLSRNTYFDGTTLRVTVKNREDGRRLWVNSEDDAIESGPGSTPIPGHTAHQWTFQKERDDGTSVAHALVSWDPDNPEDYLMAGWWAEFDPEAVSVWQSRRWALIDGPELDHGVAPEIPLDGTASYSGPAGGLYLYFPGSDWDVPEGTYVLDEYQGRVDITADFADGTLKGCLGCTGDLVTTRAHFGVFLGADIRDVQEMAKDYELHLATVIIRPDWNGQFHRDRATLRHPTRQITESDGFWGGAISSKQDADGNPRLIGGFSGVSFEEADGSTGELYGSFMALSERFRRR